MVFGIWNDCESYPSITYFLLVIHISIYESKMRLDTFGPDKSRVTCFARISGALFQTSQTVRSHIIATFLSKLVTGYL